MTNPKHKHISRKQAASEAMETTKYFYTDTWEGEADTIAVCDNCRGQILSALEPISQEELDNKTKCEQAMEFREAISKAVKDIERSAAQYLRGKQIISDEGLDLTKPELINERFDTSESRTMVSAQRGLGEPEDEAAVWLYLSQLMDPRGDEVIGDEEHVQKYGFGPTILEHMDMLFEKMLRLPEKIERLFAKKPPSHLFSSLLNPKPPLKKKRRK